MPVYKIKDKHSGDDVMVEAGRPNTALQALIADRFEVSDALSAGDALRLGMQGVPFVQGGDEGEGYELPGRPMMQGEDAGPSTRIPLSAFGSVPPMHAEDDGEEPASESDWNSEPVAADEGDE